jgi:glutaminyl-tRNA synthetase
MYAKAEELILQDKAYICELSEAVIKEQRYDRIESVYRNRPVEESLKLFREMKEGKHLEGSMVRILFITNPLSRANRFLIGIKNEM